jgi:hypothetical protein
MMILVVKCILKDPATSCIEELLVPIERINGINISFEVFGSEPGVPPTDVGPGEFTLCDMAEDVAGGVANLASLERIPRLTDRESFRSDGSALPAGARLRAVHE